MNKDLHVGTPQPKTPMMGMGKENNKFWLIGVEWLSWASHCISGQKRGEITAVAGDKHLT